MAPMNGTVSFRATGDDLIRFTVEGVPIMDTIGTSENESTSILTGEVEMVQVRPRKTTIAIDAAGANISVW